MNSRSLVVFVGLVLVASGLADEPRDLWTDYEPDVADYTVLNNGALEVYRLITNRRKHENVAVAPVDTLIEMFKTYDRGSVKDLGEFFDLFDANRNGLFAAKKYESRTGLYRFSLSQLSVGFVTARRMSCLADETVNEGIFDHSAAIYFSNFERLLPYVGQWYRDMNIDVEFKNKEFGGQECSIAMRANYFRHIWKQHRRCAVQSLFYLTKDKLKDGVEYTHMTSDLRHGDIPEVNAKYIVVPWTFPEKFAEDLELYVILPNTVDGLPEVETGITDSIIQRMANETRRGRVEVILPEISVTRKYHPLSILKNISEDPEPHQRFDLVTVTKFDIFRASAYDCYLSPEIRSMKKSGVPRFIADHPFLLLFIRKIPQVKRSLIAGMLAYKTVEQVHK